jgi:hypothetical protein
VLHYDDVMTYMTLFIDSYVTQRFCSNGRGYRAWNGLGMWVGDRYSWSVSRVRFLADVMMGFFPSSPLRLGRDADNSPPSSAEVKNAWSHTLTPPVRLHGMAFN